MKRRIHVIATLGDSDPVERWEVVDVPEWKGPRACAQQVLGPGDWKFELNEFVELDGQGSLL